MRRYRLPNWFDNRSIRNKITILYIPLVVLPLLLLGIVSNRIYTEAIVGKTEESIADNSQLIATRIQGILQNMESSANNMTLSLNRIVSEEEEPTPGEDVRYEALIVNQLSFALLVFPDVDSAAFIDAKGRVYATHSAMTNGAEQFAGSELAEQLRATSGENRWLGVQRRDFLVRTPEQTVLSLGKKVTEISTGRTLGYLVVNADETKLSGIFPREGEGILADYSIVDESGTVVSARDPGKLFAPLEDRAALDWLSGGASSALDEPFRHGDTLTVGYRLGAMGWTLVTEVPIKELTRDTSKISLIIVLIGLGCFLLVLANAGLLSRTIAAPIVRLTRAMRKVQEGSIDTRFETRGRDEIGQLGSGFNSMIGRIRELLVRVRREQRQKREYELALIQSQIKPHFLYNTLDVIYTLSEMGRTRDVQRTTKALADYYRNVLSKGREMITIAEELQNVRDYLAIQKVRYSDVFEYRIDVPAELEPYPILKLTLQPLVENAIYHGLKPTGAFGHLSVTGELGDDGILLKVTDDGVGMSEAELAAIWAADTDGNRKPSFGMRNAHERIRLYFGSGYGLEVRSAPGQGTTVTARLPASLEWAEAEGDDGEEEKEGDQR
ncbi:sensor histidine kinase [Cohnella fermenti]|uniref:Sensor histidine kinase n=1 Tax=Cohnella fermenti TaxID=2565925 RepID=A0A4S4BKA2_9BACL|nr:sensor histidine kinase [Cohnella fermenti]THF75049.1 sensor histidine kinase [Cohnella fermenti]